MGKDIVSEILKKLKSRDTQKINEGLRLLENLGRQATEERFGEIKGRSARKNTAKMVDELLKLMNDPDWHIRYAGVRGMRVIGFNHVLQPRIEEITEQVLDRLLKDEDGRVRSAAAHALGWIRMHLPEAMYAELYIELQELYDVETDRKKKRSIDQALDALWSPYLESLLFEMGFVPVTGVAS